MLKRIRELIITMITVAIIIISISINTRCFPPSPKDKDGGIWGSAIFGSSVYGH